MLRQLQFCKIWSYFAPTWKKNVLSDISICFIKGPTCVFSSVCQVTFLFWCRAFLNLKCTWLPYSVLPKCIRFIQLLLYFNFPPSMQTKSLTKWQLVLIAMEAMLGFPLVLENGNWQNEASNGKRKLQMLNQFLISYQQWYHYYSRAGHVTRNYLAQPALLVINSCFKSYS